MITSAQRLLTTLAVIALALPLVALKSCDGAAREFTGVEFFLSRSANQLGFAIMLMVVAGLLIAPWKPRPQDRPARAMVELAHAALLAAGVGLVGLIVGILPIGTLFESAKLRIGYPLVLGCWVLLYAVLVLSGLPRLVGLFAARPRWWTLLAVAAIPLVPTAKLLLMWEDRLELFAACAVVSAVVGSPIGLALVSSAEVSKRDPPTGRPLLLLAAGLWSSWIGIWTLAFG